ALVSSHYFLFEIDDDRLSRDFLGYVLRTPEFQGQIGARGSTNYAAIRPGHVLDYEIPLPDRAEQDRIVARLDAVAAKVDEARRLRAELAADARRVLESAFQRAIEGAPYRPMAEVAPLVRREVQVEPGGVYSEIGVRSFFKGVFVRRSMTGADFTWQRLFEVREGDLVFSNIMAWERAIGLATADHAGCVGNHRMLTCEPRTYAVSPAFLYYYFTTEAGFAKIAAASPGTVARNKTLTASSLAQVDVPVPPMSVQLQFAEWSARVASAEQSADDMAASTALLVDSAIQESFNAGER
ncbi:MAG: restriction endonuclease subunit S, partial [Burkholderiaceae bacterium]|nr:restriction endonuclease subunit S [Burkholderiaceae bacterium]